MGESTSRYSCKDSYMNTVGRKPLLWPVAAQRLGFGGLPWSIHDYCYFFFFLFAFELWLRL